MFKKKKNEVSKEDGLVTFETVNRNRIIATEAHDKWWKGKGHGAKSYKYHDTEQMPENFPEDLKVFAQINITKEDIEANNGIIASANLSWDARGKSRGSYDRRRVHAQETLMKWVQEDCSLKSMFALGMRDFNTCGMTYFRNTFNQYKVTNINTLGSVEIEIINPAFMKLDPTGKRFDSLGGAYIINDPVINRQQFMDQWGEHVLKSGKKIDIDQIFSSTMKEGHFDYRFSNDPANKSKGLISVVQYEYVRWLKKELRHPGTGEIVFNDNGKDPVLIPVPEYRIAIVAGDQVLVDEVSELSPLRTWTSVLFNNNPWDQGPYSVANFLEIKHLQDLINTMLSMTINSQSRQMNSPIVMLQAAANNIDRMIKDIGGYKFLFYDYPEELQNAGIPLSGAIPHRMEHGNMDNGFFSLMNWLMSMTERVQMKGVAKGRTSGGAESGVAINELQRAAMMPHRFTQEKIEKSLQLLGASMHLRAREHYTDEMEIPITTEGSERDGFTINRPLSIEELQQWIEKAKESDESAIDLEMVTVRKGDLRFTIDEWLAEVQLMGFDGDPEELEASMSEYEFIENDITFGDFDVGLTIDTSAQESKAQRVASQTIIMEAISNTGAPMAALEYGLEVSENPNMAKIMASTKEESEIWQLGMQAKQQMEEQQRMEAEEQNRQMQEQQRMAGAGQQPVQPQL